MNIKATAGISLPNINAGNNHTWHQFTIRSDRRDALQTYLKEREVDSMIYYPVPIHFHEPYKHLAPKGSLPVTEQISTEVLSLPIHQYLSDQQVQFVIDSINAF